MKNHQTPSFEHFPPPALPPFCTVAPPPSTDLRSKKEKLSRAQISEILGNIEKARELEMQLNEKYTRSLIASRPDKIGHYTPHLLGEHEDQRELEILTLEQYHASAAAIKSHQQKVEETLNATKSYKVKKGPFRAVRS